MIGCMYRGHCEGCAAMGESPQMPTRATGTAIELLPNPACLVIHPALTPPTFQYAIVESTDGGRTWTQKWRGYAPKLATPEAEYIDVTRTLYKGLAEDWDRGKKKPNTAHA